MTTTDVSRGTPDPVPATPAAPAPTINARALFEAILAQPGTSDANSLAAAAGLVLCDTLEQITALTALLASYAPVLDQVQDRMTRPMFGGGKRR